MTALCICDMFNLLKEGVSLPIKQRRNVKEGVSLPIKQRRNVKA
nr:MAG TPA: Protein of unknown function (DUF3938) [Caudoviricetes sp.]